MFLLIILVVSGCAVAAESTDVDETFLEPSALELEALLNSYAEEAAKPDPNFNSLLSGDALESAIQTQDLIKSMDLRQLGPSRFSNTRILSKGTLESCLDLGRTGFEDSNGEIISFQDRIDRQLARASFITQESGIKISLIEVGFGQC